MIESRGRRSWARWRLRPGSTMRTRPKKWLFGPPKARALCRGLGQKACPDSEFWNPDPPHRTRGLSGPAGHDQWTPKARCGTPFPPHRTRGLARLWARSSRWPDPMIEPRERRSWARRGVRPGPTMRTRPKKGLFGPPKARVLCRGLGQKACPESESRNPGPAQRARGLPGPAGPDQWTPNARCGIPFPPRRARGLARL